MFLSSCLISAFLLLAAWGIGFPASSTSKSVFFRFLYLPGMVVVLVSVAVVVIAAVDDQ